MKTTKHTIAVALAVAIFALAYWFAFVKPVTNSTGQQPVTEIKTESQQTVAEQKTERPKPTAMPRPIPTGVRYVHANRPE